MRKTVDERLGAVEGFRFTVEISPIHKMSPPWRMMIMPFLRRNELANVFRFEGENAVGVSFRRAGDAIKFDTFINQKIKENLLEPLPKDDIMEYSKESE